MIDTNKYYRVEKYSLSWVKDYGVLDGKTVKSMLKNYKYNPSLDMYFSSCSRYSFSVEEVTI